MEKRSVDLGKIFTTIAFMLVIVTCTVINMYTLIILIAMFAVAFVRKEEQTSLVSILEAVYLYLAFGIIRLIVNFFESSVGQIIVWADGNRFGVFADIFNIIGFLVTVVLAVFALISLINSLAGKPTKTMIVSGLAAKSFGIFAPKPVYYPPYGQQPYPPQNPQQPQQQADVWTCECGRTNTGMFCAGCGKPKSK